MTVTMNHAGRLVIPSEIRREAGLEPGMPLTVRCREGVIEIEPQLLAVKVARKRRLLVATPVASQRPLDTTTVERTSASLRKRGPR